MIEVQRAAAPPASLADEKDWREEDVLHQLHADFLGKCYLTEVIVPRGGFEVDHRHPRNDGGWAFDWANLYPASKDANVRRQKSWPAGGMLHPDGRGDDVEGRLIQDVIIDETDIECRFEPLNPKDLAASNTARELERLHNDDSTGPKALDLRQAIKHRLLRMTLLERQVREARAKRPDADEVRRRLEAEFRRFVSRRSPFTALVRSQVHPSLHDLFD